MKSFRILHLSDFHITAEKSFDISLVIDPLRERLKEDRDEGFQPELVVVTGDVAKYGIKAEYEAARPVFKQILDVFNLSGDRLFMVPGNHDLDRTKYRASDVPRYETVQNLNAELAKDEWRKDLLKGMTDYFAFAREICPHQKPLLDNLIPFVNTFRTEGGRAIGLIGLNSAWMCRGKSDRERIALGTFQVKQAKDELTRLNSKPDLCLFLFHHPLSWLWPEDRKTVRPFFNGSVSLSGHLHDSAGGYTEDYSGRQFSFQAGRIYPDSDPKKPPRFHYLTVDWEADQVRLDFRKFSTESQKWVLDSDTGKDGKIEFRLGALREDKIPGPAKKELQYPDTYPDWLLKNYSYLEADKLYGKGEAFSLSLPKIFVPMKVNPPDKPKGKDDITSGKTGDKGIENASRGMETQKPVDVEELMAAGETLLIEGQAGSGKTTVLKHFTCGLARAARERSSFMNLTGFLPVFILLKDLKGFFEEIKKEAWSSVRAETLLEWYFKGPMAGVVSSAEIEPFLTAGKTMLLLDGLDEIGPDPRAAIVRAFSDLQIKNRGNRIIYASRPHGIDASVVNRVPRTSRVRLLPLDMGQVKTFISQWFAFLYPGERGIGGRNASAMISEIMDHPAVEKLIDNPLMLTAICMLYHDGKQLPGQRAELYKKFIDNLLYRRFEQPEKVHDFLKTLAFNLHRDRVRSEDKAYGIGILKPFFPKALDESENAYKNRIAGQFEDIEQKCGLLKVEDGGYSFWHLTFQEFLTADFLADNSSDHAAAIASYWEDDWFQEVVELFIGYLSMDMKKAAHEIVGQALNKADNPPFKRWRLACRSLLDIPKPRRIPAVEERARERMLDIVRSRPGSRALGILKSRLDPRVRAEAGEILGWLGDPRDLTAFVTIPGGTYDLTGLGEKISIKPFEIGRYPVTNAWYEKFIRAGGYENKDFWSKEGKKWREATKAKQPGLWEERQWKCPNAPVVGVNWYEADAFCQWLSLISHEGRSSYRLPTEQEWQAAAAGFEKRKYPWGGKWDKDRCNNKEAALEKTTAVGIFPLGDTPEGVADLAGNVWEWTGSDYHSMETRKDFKWDRAVQNLRDRYLQDKENKETYNQLMEIYNDKKSQLPALRGGSFSDASDYCRCVNRLLNFPNGRNLGVGFRCARD